MAFIQGQLMPLGEMKLDNSNILVNFWGQWSENLDPVYLKENIVSIFNCFEEIFEVKYFLPKLDVVSVPFSQNSANPGLIAIK